MSPEEIALYATEVYKKIRFITWRDPTFGAVRLGPDEAMELTKIALKAKLTEVEP